eukprot:CAMPEP_0183302600 /NCGR_PEP_ID=MMETSP0160_2-20130417/8322_1 /TAXON_ID=2839 ORGANISM="Odontella Sinensis, Strain Grunow 1884" /NCGR_SAMPLE_ID=MMETSP0160_2 /ASSEMBLY_ACC=CAM_ASM_000250 /LENGTH=153 /DNA_ID=CAMNT_0025465387 /DNA_START=83 /DNA_END=540 /DNA_ORIENTATION=+
MAPSTRPRAKLLLVAIAVSFSPTLQLLPVDAFDVSPSALAVATPRLTRLCYASSLSYLPLDAIPSSPYAGLVPGLTPLVQVVEPTTESGATVFVDSGARDPTTESEAADVGDAGAGASPSRERRIVVAFRGSATPRNFATNLRFGLVPHALEP